MTRRTPRSTLFPYTTLFRSGIDRELALKLFIKATNETLSVVPDDLKTYVHICRGNYKSEHLTEGSYGPIAEVLFSQLDYDYLLVEYDDERSGDFKPLQHATKGNQIIVRSEERRVGKEEKK